MALTIIAICLFWPTAAYEVIFGDKSLTKQTAVAYPEQPELSTILIGNKDSENKTMEFINYLTDNIDHSLYCGNEIECEKRIYANLIKWVSERIFSIGPLNTYYFILISIDPNDIPNILLKVPFRDAYLSKNTKLSLLPFKALLDSILVRYINEKKLAESFVSRVDFGWNQLMRLQEENETEVTSLKPLAKFSSGVMAAHQYLGIVCIALHMSAGLVGDKESGMRALMSVMGMHRLPYIAASTTIYNVIGAILSFYGTLLIFISPELINNHLRTWDTYLLIFVNYLTISLFIIGQSFLCTTFVNSVRIITFLILVVHCLQMIIGMTILKFQLDILSGSDPYKTSKWLDYLFPVIGYLNVQIQLFTGSSASGAKAKVWTRIIYLLLMTVFNYIVGIYLDTCLDTGTGHSFPWYFPISFIKRLFKKPNTNINFNTKSEQNENNEQGKQNFIEEVNEDLVKIRLDGIQKIFKLRRCFDSISHTAVRNVTLKIQEGKITAILGHNGAGKTTTFSMILGLLRATSGKISIYGLNPDNAWDKSYLNHIVSICMQFDVLFPNLSCIEHMKLFGKFKGMNDEAIIAEINTLFVKLELVKDKNKKASILSGGQKRKLCVALALMGNPKIVLLDEPTSGVDPISRRCIWSVLKEYKKDKIIILSTHYMDEADILADWKAIMVKGSIACYGTSMFLKKKFNLGYVFTCSLSSEINEEGLDSLTQYLQYFAPHLELQKRYGMEVTYRVTQEEIINFTKHVSSVEGTHSLTKMGVIDYGISVTKLEEIFLKLGEVEEEMAHTPEVLNKKKSLEKPEENIGRAAIAQVIQTVSFEEQLISKSQTSDTPRNKITKNTNNHDLSNQETIDSKSKISLKPITTPEFQLVQDELIYNRTKKINICLIGFYQFWTYIRLNILLSLRTPMFAILRTVGPFCAIIIAALLYKFELGHSKDFNGSSLNISIVNRLLYPRMLFYRFLKNVSNFEKNYFLTDLLCIKQFYGSTLLYTNTTNEFLYTKHAAYLEVNKYTLQKQYVTFEYFTKEQFSKAFPLQSLLQNCLLMRQISNQSSGYVPMGPVNFYSIFATWNIHWAEAQHPSFTMTTAFVYLMALTIAFSLMNPVIAGDVVRDRMTQNLNQMRLYGLKFLPYWSAHFILHQLHFMAIMCFIIIAMYFVNNNLFCYPSYAGIFFIIFNLTSVDTILLIYILSFSFDDIVSAEISFSFSILIPMFIMSIVVFFPLRLIVYLHIIFIVFMPFLDPWLTIMLLDFRARRLNFFEVQSLDFHINSDFKDLLKFEAVRNSINIHIVHIILSIITFSCINFYIYIYKNRMDQSNKLFKLLRKPVDHSKSISISQTVEDMVKRAKTDIASNKSLIDEILSDSSSSCQVSAVVCDMTKIYKMTRETVVAISHMNLVINKGEVFGLLGPSGAGKTTTLNCISHMISPTTGQIIVYDQDSSQFVKSNHALKYNMIGLCPQSNPIWPNLTVREHLLVYCALRMIPRESRNDHVVKLIELVQLQEYLNTRAGSLSGGCKRRLSLAISFTGDPYLILLDEPSCGVDPKSRRNLWVTISRAIHNSHRGALITTQFMEECEALCNRLAIIVNGRIMCIGSPQELKSKFGRGISVELKMASGTDMDSNQKMKATVTDYLLERFPKLLTVECFGERISYRIPKDPNLTFGEVFQTIHEAKEIFNFEDYAVSQPTLEQIYFDFARFQTKEDLKYDIQVHYR